MIEKKFTLNSSGSEDDENSIEFDSNKTLYYPFEELCYFPITTKTSKEQFFLYFPEIDFNELQKGRKEYFNRSFDKEDSTFLKLQKDIFSHFKELYNKISLEDRFEISYSGKMSNIKPNFSFALEMSEQLKKKKFIKSKINDFVFIKKDIMKNLDLDKENIFKNSPFLSSRISFLKNTKKKLFPKFAKSIHDKEQDSSDDEEDLIEYRESLISHIDDDPVRSYKDILKQLFKMTDLRKDLINYCLDNDDKFENNNFEKFICYLEYFITLFTGIQVKYSIDELGLLNMDLYASEDTFMKMAEILHYVTQFQIRDRSYYKGKRGKSKKTIIDLNNEQYEKQWTKRIQHK